MTLSDLLSTLKTSNVQVEVTNLQGAEVCKIFSSSYSALDAAISGRTVNRWSIKAATLIDVVLDDAP